MQNAILYQLSHINIKKYFTMCFRNFTISTASIISGVQPVYGIIIGMIVLGEYPVPGTLVARRDWVRTT